MYKRQKIKRAVPITVKRTGPGYNDVTAEGELASASAIRYLLNENRDISSLLPGESKKILMKEAPVSEERYFSMLCYRALSADIAQMDKAPAGGEGLSNKLKNSVRLCRSLDDLADTLKSKRYTRTRIDRFLAQVLLAIDLSLIHILSYIMEAPFDKDVLIKGKVTVRQMRGNPYNKRTPLRILVQDESADLEVLFFNGRYLTNYFNIGSEYTFFGKIVLNNGRRQMAHPEFHKLGDKEDMRGIFPCLLYTSRCV